MRKLILILLIVFPLLSYGQTKTTVSPVKVMGIPLGITAKDFKAQVDAINDTLAVMLGVEKNNKARIICHMYEGYNDNDIVWQATIVVESKYTQPSAEGFRVTSILSAKYGLPTTQTHIDYGDCLRWGLKNGYILAWYKGSSFYAQFVDYSALKQAMPELYKNL